MKNLSNVLFAAAAVLAVIALSVPIRVIVSGRGVEESVGFASMVLGMSALIIGGLGGVARSS